MIAKKTGPSAVGHQWKKHLVLDVAPAGLSATIFNSELQVVCEQRVAYVEKQAAVLDHCSVPIDSLLRAIDNVVDLLAKLIDFKHVITICGTIPLPCPAFSGTYISTSTSYYPLDFDTLHGFAAEVNAVTLSSILTTYFTSQPATTVQELELLFPETYSSDCPILDTRVVESREIVGDISSRWVDKGFPKSCAVLSFVPSVLTTTVRNSSNAQNLNISFFDTDCLAFQIPETDSQIVIGLGGKVVTPITASMGISGGSKQKLAVFAGHAWRDMRRMVRDKYCNRHWHQFSKLAEILSPGGSLSVDDKLYIIPWTNSFAPPPWASDKMIRFHHGATIREFGDPRVNVRCVVEGQALYWRSLFLKLCNTCQKKDKGNITVFGCSDETAALPNIIASVFGLPVFTSSLQKSLGSALLARYACRARGFPWTPFPGNTLESFNYQRDSICVSSYPSGHFSPNSDPRFIHTAPSLPNEASSYFMETSTGSSMPSGSWRPAVVSIRESAGMTVARKMSGGSFEGIRGDFEGTLGENDSFNGEDEGNMNPPATVSNDQYLTGIYESMRIEYNRLFDMVQKNNFFPPAQQCRSSCNRTL